MKRMSLLASLFAGAMAFGCGSMRPNENTAQPNTVTGAAGTTSSGVDTMGNPTPGNATGQTGTMAPNPDEAPGIETGTDRDALPTGEELDSAEPLDAPDSGGNPSDTGQSGDVSSGKIGGSQPVGGGGGGGR